MTLKMWAIFIACALAGCGGGPVPPSKLSKPAAALMVPPETLADIQAGDDLGEVVARTRRSYGREATKLRRLQRWARTVTK